MNGKVKVVVWNEGDNPRTGNVTVIGEDTPANRSKAKSMLDSNTLDKAIRNCDEEKKESYPELTISNAKVGNKYAYPGGWIKLTKVWKMSEKEMKEKDLIYPWRWEGISNKGYKEGAALTH